MILKGNLRINYKLSITKNVDSYIALLKFQHPNKNWYTKDFVIRNTVKELVEFFQKNYNIEIQTDNLKKLDESRYKTKAS